MTHPRPWALPLSSIYNALSAIECPFSDHPIISSSITHSSSSSPYPDSYTIHDLQSIDQTTCCFGLLFSLCHGQLQLSPFLRSSLGTFALLSRLAAFSSNPQPWLTPSFPTSAYALTQLSAARGELGSSLIFGTTNTPFLLSPLPSVPSLTRFLIWNLKLFWSLNPYYFD